jgi:alginate O-acetyltransferase complex protein AlgI
MLFTSTDFVAFFAVLMAILAVVRNSRARFYVVLIASYIFYAAWDWRYLPLLLLVSFWNYGFGLAIEACENPRLRKAYVTIAVSGNLGALLYYKYANFFLDNIKAITGAHWSLLQITLPLGISFFTFQGVSYVVDVYRRSKPATRDLVQFLFFKAFFPQLIAGPIVRAREFLPQLQRPFRMLRPLVINGLQMFLVGAFSKLVLADNLAIAADAIFNEPGRFDTATLWLGTFAYAGQIYCDFFGYSMMAIGLSRVMGYRLPVNFCMPYVARSIQDFWRRWHMTLSRWLRDYLYISMGGNRRGAVRTYVHLITSWNFVLWGALHGTVQIIDRFWTLHRPASWRLNAGFTWVLTFSFVILAWIPFRAKDFPTTATFLRGLVGHGDGHTHWLYAPALIVLGLLVAWHVWFEATSKWHKGKIGFRRPTRFGQMGLLLLAALGIAFFAPLGGNGAFIYFQF